MRTNWWIVLIIVLLAAGLAVAAAAGTAALARNRIDTTVLPRPGLQATPQIPQPLPQFPSRPRGRDGGRWGGQMPGPGRMSPDFRQRAPLETPVPF